MPGVPSASSGVDAPQPPAPKQPRRAAQPDTSENKVQSTPTTDNDAGSTNTSRTPVQSGFSDPASPKPLQDAEQSNFDGDGSRSHTAAKSPETIPVDLTRDANLDTVSFGSKRTGNTVTSTTTTSTTTTKVEKRGQPTITREETRQPRQESFSSQSTTGQQHYQTQYSSSQSGPRRKASLYLENTPRAVSSMSVETRRVMLPAKSSGVIEERLFGIQHVHRQETDYMLDIMKARLEEHQGREHTYGELIETLQTENGELMRNESILTSEVSQLKIRLSLYEANQPGLAPSDGLDSTITTTITTIITTITDVTTQIDRWKDPVFWSNGQLSISRTDLDRLLLDLSNASTHVIKLQQDYDGLSKNFASVRHRLEITLSLCDEKDGIIASVTTEDAAKGQQIIALRRDNNSLRRDVSNLSAENEALRAPSAELDSARHEVKRMTLLIEEKDLSIDSITDQVTQLERSEAEKTKRINTLHQENGILRNDALELAELRKRYDAASKELDSTRKALQEGKNLVEEKDRTIGGLRVDVDKWKRADAIKAEQLEVKRKEKEEFEQEVAALSSKTVNLQERFDVQSKEVVSLREELQIKVTLLSEQEHTITSITSERDQAKREITVKEEQATAARKDAEQVRQKLATARDEKADLQKLFDAQLIEVTNLREELTRLEALGPVKGGTSDGHIADYIRGALDEKTKQIEELRKDLAAAVAREGDLKRLNEELSSKVGALSDDLKVETSLHAAAKSTIDSLTTQVGQLRASVTEKTEQLATALNRVRELELEVTTFTTQSTELQGRHDAQLQELVSVKNRLSTLSSSAQEKDNTISSLTTERDRLTEDITKLRQEFSAATSELTELRDTTNKQSEQLTSVRSEFEISKRSVHDKDREITTLTDKVGDLERTKASNEKRIASASQQIEDLQQKLTDARSQIAQLQHDHQMQLSELDALRAQLKAREVDDNETLSALRVQVDEWKAKCTTKGEELMIACRDRDQHRHELDVSLTRYAELEQKLTSQIEHLKQLNATGSADLTSERAKLTAARAELDTARAELEKLRRDSTSQIAEDERRYKGQVTELTSQIEKLERSYGAKEKEVAVARQGVDELQVKLGASTSLVTKLEHDCKAHSAELHFLQQQFSTIPSDSTAEEWEITKTKILSEVHDYTDVIKLTAIVEEWMSSDSKRAEVLALELEKRNKENEELRRKLLTLREIYIRAPRIKEIFQSETIEIKRRHEEEMKGLKTALSDSQSQLRGVQRVVATADTYADETILSELKKLNAEVVQNTTYMTERIAEGFRPGAAKLTKEQSQSVSRSIGEALANALASMKEEEVGLYLPIAFQAFFSHLLHQSISSWTIEKGHNDFINEIYERLQKGESQPMSGRWRALTHAYISPTWISNSSLIVKQITTELSYVVVMARCAASLDAAESKIYSFKEKVLSIITIAGRFSEMIGKTLSADFSVVAPAYLQVFDEKTMEEEDPDDSDQGKAAIQKVLCSTQLGMTKRMQRESGSETLTVLKARIFFESLLDG